jgi:2-methylcitrate dehydratase PrpD
MATLMAQRGMRAAPSILEGKFGFDSAFCGEKYDPWPLTTDFGSSYEIENSFIKPFPACAFAQTTAQAAMRLASANTINPDDIKRVKIGVYSMAKYWPGVDNPGSFKDIIQAKMSHQFMVAVALIEREISVRTVKRFRDPRLLQVAEKGNVEIDLGIE